MLPIPNTIQSNICTVLAEQGEEVPATQFPDLYADRWGRHFDYRALGYAKLTAAMHDVQGVVDAPSCRAPGNSGFSLLGVSAVKHKTKGKGGNKPPAKGGGVAYGAYKVNANGSKVGLHVNQKAPRQLMFSIAIDCSSSMRGRRIEAACEGLAEIVQDVVRDDDLYACAGFHTAVEQLHALMLKRNADLDRDLRNLRKVCDRGGSTALYDAVREGLEGLKAAVRDERTTKARSNLVLYQVIITDGGNNSGGTTLEHLKLLVAKPGLHDYHLIVIGVGELEGRDTHRALAELCAPTHATFQLAPDCAALRKKMRWARDRIQATLTTVDLCGRVSKTTATGANATEKLTGHAMAALGAGFGAMKLVAAAPATPLKKHTSRPKADGGGGGGAAFCTSCGTRKQGQNFCGNCGARSL